MKQQLTQTHMRVTRQGQTALIGVNVRHTLKY